MRRALLVPLFPFALACSTRGDDVILEPTDGAQHKSEGCAIAPGDDLCVRFPDAPADTRSVLANASSFAGEARALVLSLHAACEAILGDLRQPPPAAPANAQPSDRMKLACDAALAALGAIRPNGASLTHTPPTCRPMPIPACVLEDARTGWEICDPPKVTVVLPTDAGDQRAYVSIVEQRTPPIFAVRSTLEHISLRARAVSGGVGAFGAIDEKCVTSAVKLVTDATADVEASTTVGANAERALVK